MGPCLIHTCHAIPMPRPCHALTMPFFSRLRHNTAIVRRPVGYLPAFSFFRLPRGVPWRVFSEACQSSSQRSMLTTVESGSNTLQKTRGLAARIFPTTKRTFTKDTALSEQGRGAAWHVWINGTALQGNGMGTPRARHGHGMLCESAFSVHSFIQYSVWRQCSQR
jgi:hypothetical protein